MGTNGWSGLDGRSRGITTRVGSNVRTNPVCIIPGDAQGKLICVFPSLTPNAQGCRYSVRLVRKPDGTIDAYLCHIAHEGHDNKRARGPSMEIKASVTQAMLDQTKRHMLADLTKVHAMSQDEIVKVAAWRDREIRKTKVPNTVGSVQKAIAAKQRALLKTEGGFNVATGWVWKDGEYVPASTGEDGKAVGNSRLILSLDRKIFTKK